MTDPRPISAAALCIHPAPEYVSAFLAALLDDYSRVYWNVYQQECPLTGGPGIYGHNRHDGDVLNVPGLVVRSYWWGNDDDPRAQEANWEFDGVAFTWYKHPIRGLEANVQWEPHQWVEWFDKCLAAIRTADIW